jgi:hypothetical protein
MKLDVEEQDMYMGHGTWAWDIGMGHGDKHRRGHEH